MFRSGKAIVRPEPVKTHTDTPGRFDSIAPSIFHPVEVFHQMLLDHHRLCRFAILHQV